MGTVIRDAWHFCAGQVFHLYISRFLLNVLITVKFREEMSEIKQQPDVLLLILLPPSYVFLFNIHSPILQFFHLKIFHALFIFFLRLNFSSFLFSHSSIRIETDDVMLEKNLNIDNRKLWYNFWACSHADSCWIFFVLHLISYLSHKTWYNFIPFILLYFGFIVDWITNTKYLFVL